jgi:high-affinity Fe2+/Pb2+ permease
LVCHCQSFWQCLDDGIYPGNELDWSLIHIQIFVVKMSFYTTRSYLIGVNGSNRRWRILRSFEHSLAWGFVIAVVIVLVIELLPGAGPRLGFFRLGLRSGLGSRCFLWSGSESFSQLDSS